MWERWCKGDSLHAIARLLNASHTSVRRNLLVTGGIRPARRHRSRLALTLSEREVHTFLSTVLFGVSWLDAFDLDTQAQPRHGEFTEAEQGV
jgi:hypothetical protein